jgi:hypothetical protein
MKGNQSRKMQSKFPSIYRSIVPSELAKSDHLCSAKVIHTENAIKNSSQYHPCWWRAFLVTRQDLSHFIGEKTFSSYKSRPKRMGSVDERNWEIHSDIHSDLEIIPTGSVHFCRANLGHFSIASKQYTVLPVRKPPMRGI